MQIRHIAESEAMRGYIDKELYPCRPILHGLREHVVSRTERFLAHRWRIFPRGASFSLLAPSLKPKNPGANVVEKILCLNARRL
jgi:hypothetical protein